MLLSYGICAKFAYELRHPIIQIVNKLLYYSNTVKEYITVPVGVLYTAGLQADCWLCSKLTFCVDFVVTLPCTTGWF